MGNKFQLVVAVGKIGQIRRQFCFFCLYIEPRMKAAQLAELNELLTSQILQLRSKGDPYIFVGGDLNRRHLEAMDDFPDIMRLNHEPTRGDACLDVMYSNLKATESVWPPLMSRAGTASDHACVVLSTDPPEDRDFHWITKTVRKHTGKAVWR